MQFNTQTHCALLQGPRMVRDVFRLAKENEPAIIFIDEVDAIATARFDAQTAADRCRPSDSLFTLMGAPDLHLQWHKHARRSRMIPLLALPGLLRGAYCVVAQCVMAHSAVASLGSAA